MGLCVLCDTLLSKSRHRVEGDSVTVKFSVLTCENEEGNDEYAYWVTLEDSEGETVMKEVNSDFITACEIHERLKKTLGADIA